MSDMVWQKEDLQMGPYVQEYPDGPIRLATQEEMDAVLGVILPIADELECEDRWALCDW